MRDGTETNYWQLGTWKRVPVAMHWTVLLSFAWMYLVFWSVPAALVGSVWLFLLFIAHELGHVAVLRWKKIPVESITFFGIHGETGHGYAGPAAESAIAWGGVAAQLLVLLLTLGAVGSGALGALPGLVATTLYTVFVNLNVFLMIIALLPIGPFDGRAAWSAFPQMRAGMRRRKRAAFEKKAAPENFLSPEKRRELEESSAKEAADLLEKMKK